MAKQWIGSEEDLIHIIRREAGALVKDRRRFILKDFGGMVLEGKVEFREYQGTLQVLIDGTDVTALFKLHFLQGQKVRMLVMDGRDQREDAWPLPKKVETDVPETLP